MNEKPICSFERMDDLGLDDSWIFSSIAEGWRRLYFTMKAENERLKHAVATTTPAAESAAESGQPDERVETYQKMLKQERLCESCKSQTVFPSSEPCIHCAGSGLGALDCYQPRPLDGQQKG